MQNQFYRFKNPSYLSSNSNDFSSYTNLDNYDNQARPYAYSLDSQMMMSTNNDNSSENSEQFGTNQTSYNFTSSQCQLLSMNTKKQITHWNSQENGKYKVFCDDHFDMLNSTDKKMRKEKKIFLLMSKFIETKTPAQCKSHHQKSFPKLIELQELEELQELQDLQENKVEVKEEDNSYLYPSPKSFKRICNKVFNFIYFSPNSSFPQCSLEDLSQFQLGLSQLQNYLKYQESFAYDDIFNQNLEGLEFLSIETEDSSHDNSSNNERVFGNNNQHQFISQSKCLTSKNKQKLAPLKKQSKNKKE